MNSDERLDAFFELTDGLIADHQLEALNSVLFTHVFYATLDPVLAVGFMRACSEHAHRLTDWNACFQRVSVYLRTQGLDPKLLLGGLKPND